MKGHCLGGNGSYCELMIFAHFIFLRMKENPKQSEEGRKSILSWTSTFQKRAGFDEHHTTVLASDVVRRNTPDDCLISLKSHNKLKNTSK